MKTKIKLFSGLALGFVGCALLGMASVQTPATAFADTIGGVNVTSFTMQYGASVRKTDDGIRFSAQLDADEYRALEALEDGTVTVSYGMLITTAYYANQYPLTVDNVFGASAKYYWEGSGDTTGKVPMVNKISATMGKAEGASYAEPYLLYGSVIDAIPDGATPEEKKIYLQGEYVGLAYIAYNNGTTTSYFLAKYAKDDAEKVSVANNTRSMMQVALNRINSGDEASATLLENYVKPVVGSTYKINRYINSHNQGNVLMDTTEVTSNSTANVITQAMQMDGYTGQDVTVTKDGSGNIVVNCVLAPNDVIVTAKNGATMTIPNTNVFYIKDQVNFDTVKLGVYYNASGLTWTLNSRGNGGQVAVLNPGGELIEGRDGDNGKYVNAKNPIRVTSPKVDGLESEYAQNISVPHGYYVIIIPGGQTYTADRAFMRDYVLNEYQNTVKLNMVGASKSMTQYLDHHDVFGNTNVLVNAGSFATVAEVKAYMLSGMKLVNDNRTFDVSDDITGYDKLQITDLGGFSDVNTPGEYTFTMKATKENSSETLVFPRKLTVLSAYSDENVNTTNRTYKNDVRMYIKERSTSSGQVFQVDGFQATGKVGLNSTADVIHTQFTILSYDYLTEGEGASYTGSELQYGIAYLVDKTGKITEIFDGAIGGENAGAYYGPNQYTCINTQYGTNAITAFKAGNYSGGYIIIAPTSTNTSSDVVAENNNLDANGKRGSRTFLKNNLVLNRYIECTAMFFTYNDAYAKVDDTGADISNWTFSTTWDYFL